MSVSGIGSRLPYAPPTGVPTPATGGPRGGEGSSKSDRSDRSDAKVSGQATARTTPVSAKPISAEVAARAVERENVAAANARSLGYHEANALLAGLLPQRGSLDVQL
jgi:hypothetical protein